MKNKLFTLSLLILTISVSACSISSNKVTATESKSNDALKAQTPPTERLSKGTKAMSKWYTGTIKYFNLEGGFYGFVGQNGERFLPLNLTPKHKQNGIKVKILGHQQKDVMTVTMWGTPFTIVELELIEPDQK